MSFSSLRSRTTSSKHSHRSGSGSGAQTLEDFKLSELALRHSAPRSLTNSSVLASSGSAAAVAPTNLNGVPAFSPHASPRNATNNVPAAENGSNGSGKLAAPPASTVMRSVADVAKHTVSMSEFQQQVKIVVSLRLQAFKFEFRCSNFQVCGPYSFMSSALEMLLQMGVPETCIECLS